MSTTFTHEDKFRGEVTYWVPTEAADVTEEIEEAATDVCDSYFPEGKIEWDDVWDRMEGRDLKNGMTLSMGDEVDTPAMRKIQRFIRNQRRYQ